MLSRPAIDGTILLATTLCVAALGFLFLGLWALPRRGDEMRRRLRGGRTAAIPGPPEATGVGKALARGLGPLANIVRPTRTEELSRLRRNMVQAGFSAGHALEVFLATKVVLATALPLAFLWMNSRLAEPSRLAIPIAIWICSGAFFVPNAWLASRRNRRQRLIDHALPDTLDLLVTSVEAGLGLDAALQRVAEETTLSSPILAGELKLTFLEINAGVPRTEAFRRLAERTGVEEIKSLAATLTQTEMFGTSVGQALRVQATSIRIRRMQKAEERAATVSVKMTVPLVLCILPSLLAIIMGPAIVNIANSLMKTWGK